MTDAVLTLLASLCLAVCLTTAILDHTHQDDARRAELAACVDGWEASAALNRVCLDVVDDCHNLVTGGACSCWVPGGSP